MELILLFQKPLEWAVFARRKYVSREFLTGDVYCADAGVYDALRGMECKVACSELARIAGNAVRGGR